ncbi:MAG: LssY C-terminal domain-containing protein [Chthoniobacteraceae bacterium]
MSDSLPPTRILPRLATIIACSLGLYLLIAYVVMPRHDRRLVERDPALDEDPRLTHTGTGLPGDPLNIEVLGTEDELIRAMAAAGWNPATSLTFDSSVRIAVDTVFRKPDKEAPVSSLFLFGRKEDLAFEKPVGDSPKERHHVRFWKTQKTDNGRPVWMGSAAFDIGVELSRTTGEVTHHISPDVDAERDLLLADLAQGKHLEATRWIDGFHKKLEGKNGGGDPWHTDGRLAVAVLTATPGTAESAR